MKPLHHPYFVSFIIYFNHNQDFFECHEVLEAYWKDIPNRTKEHPLTAYILLSTGLYHWRRENYIGALRTLRKASIKMDQMLEHHPHFTKGIDFNSLYDYLQNSIQSIEARQPFIAFSIPITSVTLQQRVIEQAPDLKLLPINSDEIIHKHLLRNRSEMIRLRNEKKKGRR